MSLELVTVGRVSVDLYAREQGVGFADVETFAKSIGGSPTNVAVAAARLGRRAAVITAVGDDPFGEYVRGALADRFGVDVRFVGTHPTLRTPLAFAAMDPPEEPQLLFYREPAAPDMQIELAAIDRDAVRAAAILWISASALSAEPSRGTTLALMRDRDRATTILDLDYRPTFWRDEAEASAVIGAALALAGTAVGNREECRVAVGTAEPQARRRRAARARLPARVVKQGGEGVLVATPDERELVPGLRVPVVCGLGAGDAFGGALCHGLLAGRPPAECVRFANGAGAIVASRLLCADAMPEESEVRALLDGGDRVKLHLPAGNAAAGDDPLLVTPESAGWPRCGLRIVRLAPGGSRVLASGGDELAVLPLRAAACTVEVEGRRFELSGARACSRA